MRMNFTEAEIDYIEKNIGKQNLYGDTRNRVIASLYSKGAIQFFDLETMQPVVAELRTPFDVVGCIIRFAPELVSAFRRNGGLR